MKKLIIFVLFLAIGFSINAQDDKEHSAYYKIASLNSAMDATATDIKEALTSKSFKIIGEYHPGNNKDLYVICYTRDDLEKITLGFQDRGALAAALKIGIKNNGDTLDVTMINPMYLFYAYLIDNIDPYEDELEAISSEAKDAMQAIGTEFTAFGGAMTKEDLQDYHYKMMMPYFDDPEELNEFDSFEEGLDVILKNLDAGKGNTVKVYGLIYPEKEVAVIGVGLLDQEEGESHFLPIIGDDHICAMPYEMILQGNTVTMLPGRYRIAVHWPELTMGTFIKIMSTPGKIEDFLEGLTE